MPLTSEELLKDEQKAAFDAKYGEDRWAIISKNNRKNPDLIDFQIAFRAPTSAEFQLFKSRSVDKATQGKASEMLIKQCLLHPTREKLDAFLEMWPGIPESDGCQKAIREMTGMVGDEVEK